MRVWFGRESEKCEDALQYDGVLDARVDDSMRGVELHFKNPEDGFTVRSLPDDPPVIILGVEREMSERDGFELVYSSEATPGRQRHLSNCSSAKISVEPLQMTFGQRLRVDGVSSTTTLAGLRHRILRVFVDGGARVPVSLYRTVTLNGETEVLGKATPTSLPLRRIIIKARREGE